MIPPRRRPERDGASLFLVRSKGAPAVLRAAHAPFPVDVVVLEEDTALVLSADQRVRDPGTHPIRLMTALHETPLEAPGTVLHRPGTPPRLLAVVHDLAEEPSWREAWVRTALDRIVAWCDEHDVVALGLEPLGCRHRRLPEKRFGTLLEAALAARQPKRLRRIWWIA